MRTKEAEIARDQEIVELIHQNTLKILEEIGIAFLSEEALDLLRSNGVKVEGNRAYFTPEQVMHATGSLHSFNTETFKSKFHRPLMRWNLLLHE